MALVLFVAFYLLFLHMLSNNNLSTNVLYSDSCFIVAPVSTQVRQHFTA